MGFVVTVMVRAGLVGTSGALVRPDVALTVPEVAIAFVQTFCIALGLMNQ